MNKLFINLCSLSGVSVLVKSLIITTGSTGAIFWLLPSLSPNDVAKIVTLPMVSSYIVIRFIDAGLAALVSETHKAEPLSKKEWITLFCFTFGLLSFLISFMTAALYNLVELDTGAEIMLWIAGISSIITFTSVIVLFRDMNDKNKPLNQAHDIIHSPLLFSHVIKQCHRRRVA